MDRRTLAYAVIAIGCMLLAALVLPWFTVDGHASLSLNESGMFGDNALWSAVIFSIIVVYELGSVVFAYEISAKRIRWCYGVGASVVMSTVWVAYIAAPEVAHIAGKRTWAPLLMLVGGIAGLAVGYRINGGGGTGSEYIGEYKPIVIEKKK